MLEKAVDQGQMHIIDKRQLGKVKSRVLDKESSTTFSVAWQEMQMYISLIEH